MNKLTELWIKVTKETEIEEYHEDVRELYEYTRQLQQKVNQLETNIDDAIEIIDIYTDGINLEAFDCLDLMYKIEEILERGKE
jgi:hypothetical protein